MGVTRATALEIDSAAAPLSCTSVPRATALEIDSAAAPLACNSSLIPTLLLRGAVHTFQRRDGTADPPPSPMSSLRATLDSFCTARAPPTAGKTSAEGGATPCGGQSARYIDELELAPPPVVAAAATAGCSAPASAICQEQLPGCGHSRGPFSHLSQMCAKGHWSRVHFPFWYL